jgi:hypothetical protein
MAKKMKKTTAAPKTQDHLEVPEYESLTTVEEIEELLVEHKEKLVGKDKLEYQIKETKRETNADLNEQLKELKQEREHEMGVIDALYDRKKQILASVGIATVPSVPTH